MHCCPLIIFVLILLSTSRTSQSWSFFSSSSLNEDRSSGANYEPSNGVLIEFSMDGLMSSQKGKELVENARSKMLRNPNSCWQNAYQSLFAGCSEIVANEEMRNRLAWQLTDCFQQDSQTFFPHCDGKSPMKRCRQKLSQHENSIFLEFFLQTNTICHQLQTHAFKHDTDRLVNELKKSANFANEKLDIMEERSDRILQNSNDIHNSLSSIDVTTQQLAQASKDVEERIDNLVKESQKVYDQSKEITATQKELQDGQVRMRDKLVEGMETIKDSYNKLGEEMNDLKDETAKIEKEINKVGNEMVSKMNNLQTKADDIESIAGSSLDKQKKLLDGQNESLERLQFLKNFQSRALEESRKNLEKLAEFGRKQQQELLQQQKQLQSAHEHLVENSKIILAAQEEFEAKQASMFVALDKLFALHNALLLESRSIKTFFVYFLSIFVVYMFTGTKQTYAVRPRLYIGLTFTFLIEFAILRFAATGIELQTRNINVVRWTSALLSLGQLLYAIYAYRDYEVLNHHMLQSLMDKVNCMQKYRDCSWDTDEEDDDVLWSRWIDTDLPEDVDGLQDPDFLLPEEVVENSITTTLSLSRKYNLRKR